VNSSQPRLTSTAPDALPDTSPSTLSLQQVLAQALDKTQNLSEARITQILAHKLPAQPEALDFASVWPLAAYSLERASQVQAASPEAQQRLLARLARGRFVEAYQIEKAGMSFAAKMSLLAESIAEQKLYSLFASEEAQHFHFIQGVLGDDLPNDKDPFITLLHELITHAPRRPLQFMIQVVLEGWGIEHYTLMMKACQHPGVRPALQRILQDEASHHSSGVALFAEADLSPAEATYTLEMMQHFLQLVSIGPVSVLQAVHEELGGLSQAQQAVFWDETQAKSETRHKLDLLQNLMHKAQAHKLLARLQAQDAFALRC